MLRGCLSVAPYYVTYRTAQTYRGAYSSLRESIASLSRSGLFPRGCRVDIGWIGGKYNANIGIQKTACRINYSAGGFLFILFGA